MEAAALWLTINFFDFQDKSLTNFYKDIHQVTLSHSPTIAGANRLYPVSETDRFKNFYVTMEADFKKLLPDLETSQILQEVQKDGIRFEPSLEEILKTSKEAPLKLPLSVKLIAKTYDNRSLGPDYQDFSMKFAINMFKRLSRLLVAQDKEKQLLAIARFHKFLEGNHFFRDGNSRTHLLILQFTLAACRYHPTLVDPNGSYLVSAEEWKETIKKGFV